MRIFTIVQFVVFVIALFCIRCLYVVYLTLSHRKNKANASISVKKQKYSELAQNQQPLSRKRIMVILGSGGHTSEMMSLLSNLRRDRPEKITFIIGETDVTSEARTRAYNDRVCESQRQSEGKNAQNITTTSLRPSLAPSSTPAASAVGSTPSSSSLSVSPRSSEPLSPLSSSPTLRAQWSAPTEFVKIPRAREVGQSYLTSIFSTLRALLFCISLVIREKPDVILTNGPGTAVPVCWASFIFLRVLMLGGVFKSEAPRIVFVESYARVKRLSLTGFILYPIASRFIVQWPQLCQKYPLTEYIGQLC